MGGELKRSKFDFIFWGFSRGFDLFNFWSFYEDIWVGLGFCCVYGEFGV